jgi:hypothetical protein
VSLAEPQMLHERDLIQNENRDRRTIGSTLLMALFHCEVFLPLYKNLKSQCSYDLGSQHK